MSDDYDVFAPSWWGIGAILVGLAAGFYVGDHFVNQRPTHVIGMWISVKDWMTLCAGGGGLIGTAVGMVLREFEDEHRFRKYSRALADEKHRREEALAIALQAAPYLVDDETLRDENGEYGWPDHLFYRHFKKPQRVVKFYRADGHAREIRLWSKRYVDECAAKDQFYQVCKAENDAKRKSHPTTA